MMRVCPKCGDFYAEGSSPFCLTDGTPLVGVAPDSDAWGEGVRVVQEKGRVLRKLERKRKWRRVVTSVTTTLITTTVVCVLAVNSYIYLKPTPAAEVLTQTLIPPTASDAPPDPSPPSAPADSTPEPSPQPTVTREPTPTATETVTPTPDIKSPATPTPTTSPTVSPTVSATPTMTPTPPPPPPTPTLTASPTTDPTTDPSVSVTASPTPAKPPPCSDADKSRAREMIISLYGGGWQGNIKREQRRIIAENTPDGGLEPKADLVALEYGAAFSKDCNEARVTTSYVWQVSAFFADGSKKVVNVPKKKSFRCTRFRGVWVCLEPLFR